MKDPFTPLRVDVIINMVQIGDDISPDETTRVCDLLCEFADIFALSIKEVKPLSSIKYHLNIPEGLTFSVKANQQPLNQAQKNFYFSKLTEFVDARVLKLIHVSQVKALHPMVLAQKAHETPGLTIDEICQEVNKQCILLGEQPDPNVLWCTGPPMTQVMHPQTNSKKPKWHIMQNFSQLSRVCKSAQMPQGDLWVKQQHLAGNHFLCVIDFASGFYALEVDKSSQPYLCIYTEGIRYHAYARMPMGIADALSWFCDTMARALHDLITKIQLEIFVDDNAIAGNNFSNVLQRLQTFFK